MVANTRSTPLDSFVDSAAPICYGILKPGEHYPEGIPVIKVKNIYSGRILQDELLRTTPEIHAQYQRAEVKSGDLLLTIRGSTGRVAIVPESLNGANITQDTARIRVSSDDDPIYLFYALQSPQVQRQIELNTVGQAVKGINIAEVRKLKIFHPEGGEQKKIAEILSTWDKAIANAEQLLANGQQQKKALMQQLLTGKKRLPGFTKKWSWLKASDVFKTVSKKNNSDDEELLAVTQDQGVLPRSLLERRVVMPDGNTKGYKLVIPGNFIISLRSFQGGLEYSSYRGLVSPAYTVLEPIQEISDEFYKQYYKSYDFIGHLAVAVIGIRDGKQISYSDFSFLKLPYPDLEEQHEIASVLSTAELQIEILQKKLEHLKQEKKALMQQLLTGKRRVKVAGLEGA